MFLDEGYMMKAWKTNENETLVCDREMGDEFGDKVVCYDC